MEVVVHATGVLDWLELNYDRLIDVVEGSVVPVMPVFDADEVP